MEELANWYPDEVTFKPQVCYGCDTHWPAHCRRYDIMFRVGVGHGSTLCTLGSLGVGHGSTLCTVLARTHPSPPIHPCAAQVNKSSAAMEHLRRSYDSLGGSIVAGGSHVSKKAPDGSPIKADGPFVVDRLYACHEKVGMCAMHECGIL
jgi:hypothetical protein